MNHAALTLKIVKEIKQLVKANLSGDTEELLKENESLKKEVKKLSGLLEAQETVKRKEVLKKETRIKKGNK